MLAHFGFLLIVITNLRTVENKYGLGYYGTAFDRIPPIWREYDKLKSVYKRETIENPQGGIRADSTLKTQSTENTEQKNSYIAQDKQVKENVQNVPFQSEGGVVNDHLLNQTLSNQTIKADVSKEQSNITTKELPKENIPLNASAIIVPVKNTTSNATEATNALPINNPGVVKRGLIVFGGFALLAIAYFVFYRRKGKNFDSNNTHNNNDTNQFRYGVLQSEDGRDNLELSRIPLTMESDEDDEEDLEIFDLEQKKKSLSYVNLQTNDEDIVFQDRKDESKNNLLLDIEDGPSDMINWSSNGNKSIL